MKQKIVFGFLIVGMASALGFVWTGKNCALGSAETKPAVAVASATRQAVVVELFTSEGCSSCPPADKLLTWLADQQPLSGVEIIPLSEHVDYWNHQGWADPYSSAAFTERQHEYSGSLGTGVYTPEMVVDGKVGFVGGDSHQAMKVISDESRLPKAKVQIQLNGPADSRANDKVSFSVRVEKLPPLEGKKKAVVFLAITESNLRSSVSAGENSGRLLTHTAVVRELKSIGHLDATPEATFSGQPVVGISKGWKRADLRAVVWVQVQDDHKILGAAEAHFPGL